MAKENPGQLSELSSSLISETNRYLSLDRSVLQTVDFKAFFEEHLRPFERRYEEAKETATILWQNYSAVSNQLDFLPLESDEYKSLDAECDTAKTEYDEAHARVNLYITSGSRSVTGISMCTVSSRCSLTFWWNA